MRNRLLHSILASIAGLIFLPVALAQTGSQPDLSGIWARPRNVPAAIGETPQMLPAAKRIYDENRRGQVPDRDEGLDELDPTIYCLPHGFPRALTTNNPFEIVQTAKVVYMLFESTQMQRRIYLDGRKMPAQGYPNTFMGFSTGKYDGGTLIAETGGLNDLTWIDSRGIPHSEELRITERIRRASPTALEIDVQYTDPKSFARPWGGKKTFQLMSDWQIMEHIGYCEDRFRYNYDNKIFRGTVRWQSPEQAEGTR